MKIIKPLIVVLIVAAFITIVLIAPQGQRSGRSIASVGIKAPDFRLNEPNGKTWQLSDMQGSVVLINFWATWCSSCRDEMPSLQNLYNIVKGDPRFHLITILHKDSPENASSYLKQNSYSLPFVTDTDGSVSAAYGLTGVPETFIVDKKGVLRDKIIGPVEFNSKETVEYLTRLIEE